MDKFTPSVLWLAFGELERIHQVSRYEGDQISKPMTSYARVESNIWQFSIVILSPLEASLTSEALSSGDLNSAIKDVHYLVDQLIRTNSMLGQNIKVISAITVKIGSIRPYLAEATLTEDVEVILREHRVLLDSATCLLERAMNVSNHVGTQ